MSFTYAYAEELGHALARQVATHRQALTEALAHFSDDEVRFITAEVLADQQHLWATWHEGISQGWAQRWMAVEVLAVAVAADALRKELGWA